MFSRGPVSNSKRRISLARSRTSGWMSVSFCGSRRIMRWREAKRSEVKRSNLSQIERHVRQTDRQTSKQQGKAKRSTRTTLHHVTSYHITSHHITAAWVWHFLHEPDDTRIVWRCSALMFSFSPFSVSRFGPVRLFGFGAKDVMGAVQWSLRRNYNTGFLVNRANERHKRRRQEGLGVMYTALRQIR
jgi:hypothetical protein